MKVGYPLLLLFGWGQLRAGPPQQVTFLPDPGCPCPWKTSERGRPRWDNAQASTSMRCGEEKQACLDAEEEEVGGVSMLAPMLKKKGSTAPVTDSGYSTSGERTRLRPCKSVSSPLFFNSSSRLGTNEKKKKRKK